MQGGDRQEMAEATAEERALVTELAGAAAAIAGEAGLATGSSLEEKLRATLHAAATNEETAGELMAGRLVRERKAVGLFGLVEAPPAPAKRAEPKRKPPKRTKQSEDGDRAAAERAAAEEANRRTRELERDLRAAAAEEKQARRHLQRAERSAASARERAEAAAERLEDAEKERDEASTALEEAATEVSRLEEELTRGATQVTPAQQAPHRRAPEVRLAERRVDAHQRQLGHPVGGPERFDAVASVARPVPASRAPACHRPRAARRRSPRCARTAPPRPPSRGR